MRFHYIFCLCLFILLFSCDDTVELDDFSGNLETLILTNGTLSPQNEILKIQVSKTISATQPIELGQLETLAITNTIVTLNRNGGNVVTLNYVPTSLNYQIPANSLPIIAGERYQLKVIVDSKEFTSDCVIPLNSVSSLSSSTGENLDKDGNLRPSVTINFQDITGSSNHYIIGAEPVDYVISSFMDFETRRFARDEIADGQSFSAYGFFTTTNIETVEDIALRVANVEPILYDNLFAQYSNKENVDNPFYEPIIPPNNIQGENGYGVFAGYQLQETVINY